VIARSGHRRRKRRIRRSPHLVAYWQDGTLLACNYATATTVRITPFICGILDICTDWTPAGSIAPALGTSVSASLEVLINRLVALGLLEEAGQPADPRERAMATLASWNPEAGFFHAATRDVPFASARRVRQLRLRAAERPMPAVVKRYGGAERVWLPRPRSDGEFARVLRARRTWRRFSAERVTLHDLATLLAFTSGVQHWVAAGGRRLALKISPSGGARHAIECYVVARTIDGLGAGIYHYAADVHALERLRGPVPGERLRAYVPHSGYFANASAMVFFTAIFDRIIWRYPYSRAYRAALVEAGHVCQTFCLTATWLGLAPYCLLGLADSLIERDLGIDGIREAVLYAAGVGRQPPRSAWAPLPAGGKLPIRPNRRM
jgi:SagB-type dehydrogenase family enzyme